MSFRTKATKAAIIPVAALGILSIGTTGPAGASSKVTTVTAKETEFHIALSVKTFSPGKYVFVAENKGTITHALEITGPGLKNATTADLAPGKSAKLKVTLKKGKYDVFCPVPGHKAMGMNANISVGSAGTKLTSTATTKASSGGYGY
jgi:plastocyanin